MTPSSTLHGSETMSPPNGADPPAKRKSEESAPQPRTKRNRYISIACNECKRRKIKCNGETPCQRCGNLNLNCLYAPNCCNNFKDSEEFKQMTAHISNLQEQVEQLFSNMENLRSQVDTQSMGSMGTPFTGQEYHRAMSMSQSHMLPQSPSRPRPKQFRKYHGPTSSAFNLGVAKSSLQTMGITAPGEEDGATQDVTPAGSPPPMGPMLPKPPLHADKDPIWSLSKHDAMRLIHVWHEEMGLMYPFMDIEKVIRYAEGLFTFLEAAARTGLMQGGLPGSDQINDDRAIILKLILAVALVVEGTGKDPLGEKLFENVLPFVQKAFSGPVHLQTINMVALTGMYYFHRDDEELAWRMSGFAARQCLELGLHRRETYTELFSDPAEHTTAVQTFWSIYILDRRWSFGTGMPFALQDSDIDPDLPKPDDTTPYLNAMISYNNIGSKVWRSVANADAPQKHINKEDMSFLDFQILNWHRTIPDSLKYAHPETGQPAEMVTRGLHRLQVALYLRANQMRILIYRPVLYTATSIMEHPEFAHIVVKVSKDTIRTLTYINQTSDIYRTQQCMFNYFLISALAVLFLAVAHAPAEFSGQCRDEFYMALDLVRGLSSTSHVSKRLWKTIRLLKEVGPRLGLVVSNGDTGDVDAHSSAAVAMAGLAGHRVDETAMFPNGRNGHVDTPHGMAHDLTSLFEAAGGLAYSSMMQNGYGHLAPGDMSGGGEFPIHEDELARIMRDLF